MPAQALPLAFWMGAGGAVGGGTSLVAAQVQSTLPPPPQGSQHPTARPPIPVAPPVLAPPPEVGKGEPPAPEGGLQPLPTLQSKESSGSVQREGAADSSSSTVSDREQGESGGRASRGGGGCESLGPSAPETGPRPEEGAVAWRRGGEGLCNAGSPVAPSRLKSLAQARSREQHTSKLLCQIPDGIKSREVE